MTRTLLYRGLILMLLLLYGCSEVINLNERQAGGELVIFGRLTDGTFGNYVNVTRTGPAGGLPVPVNGAIVRIADGRGNVQELIPGDSGNYELPPNFIFGQVGESYTLDVQVGEEHFITAPQLMPENYGREEMSFEIREVESISADGALFSDLVVSVFANTTFDELPEEFYLRWDIEEAFTYLGTPLPANHFTNFAPVQCFVIRDLNEQRIFLHNGAENRAAFVPDQLYVNRLIDESFEALHYFNLIRCSLSEETYDYWFRLDQTVNRQGSIFDVPPAPIPGNIFSTTTNEPILGYFEVVNADTTRLALTRNDVPFFVYDPCALNGDDQFREVMTVPRNCKQCLVDRGIKPVDCIFCGFSPNNTGRRPSYF